MWHNYYIGLPSPKVLEGKYILMSHGVKVVEGSDSMLTHWTNAQIHILLCHWTTVMKDYDSWMLQVANVKEALYIVMSQ